MKQDKQQPGAFSNLFEQAAQISKAHAYDIVSEQVKELKEVIRELVRVGELEDITFTDEAATKLFQYWVNRAKTLSL